MFLLKKQVVRQRIVHSGLWRVSMTCGALGVRFSTYVVIARILEVQEFGVLLVIQAIAASLVPAIGIGMTPLASRSLVQIGQVQTARNLSGIFSLLWRLQCRRMLFSCIIYVPLAFLLSLCSKGPLPFMLLLIAGLAVLPVFLGSIVSTTLQGLRRYDLLAGMRFIYTLLYLCLALLGTHTPVHMRLDLLLLAPAFANLVTLTIALVYLTALLPLSNPIEPGPLLRERVERGQSSSWRLFLLDSIVWRELLSLLLLLFCWHTTTVLGFYALGILLCTYLMKALPAFFITYLLPLISRSMTVGPRNVYDAFVYTSCIVASITIVLYALLALCCPTLIVLYLGASYLPMATPLRILLIAVVFGSSTTVNMAYLVGHLHKREQLWLGGGVVALHVVLGIPCIALWGITGAAIASAITHASVAIAVFLLCRQYLLQRQKGAWYHTYPQKN